MKSHPSHFLFPLGVLWPIVVGRGSSLSPHLLSKSSGGLDKIRYHHFKSTNSPHCRKRLLLVASSFLPCQPCRICRLARFASLPDVASPRRRINAVVVEQPITVVNRKCTRIRIVDCVATCGFASGGTSGTHPPTHSQHSRR